MVLLPLLGSVCQLKMLKRKMGNVENKHSAPCQALPSYACNSLGCSYLSSQSADTIGQLDIGLCDL